MSAANGRTHVHGRRSYYAGDYIVTSKYFSGLVRCSFPLLLFPTIKHILVRLTTRLRGDPVHFRAMMMLPTHVTHTCPTHMHGIEYVPHTEVFVRDMLVRTPEHAAEECAGQLVRCLKHRPEIDRSNQVRIHTVP